MIWYHPSLCLWRTPRTWTPWCIYTCWSSPWTFLKLLKNTFLCQPDDEQICLLLKILNYLKSSWIDHINGKTRIIVRVNWIFTSDICFMYIHRVIHSKIDKLKCSVFQNLEYKMYSNFFKRNVSLGMNFVCDQIFLIRKPEYLPALNDLKSLKILR